MGHEVLCCTKPSSVLKERLHISLSKSAQRPPGERGCLTTFLLVSFALVAPSPESDTVLPLGCCSHAVPGPMTHLILLLCRAHRLTSDHQAYSVTLDGEQFVAKFAHRPYPCEVHKCWAARGRMPGLRTASDGQEVTHVPGGWSLVFMDYLSPSDEWRTLQEVRIKEQRSARKVQTNTWCQRRCICAPEGEDTSCPSLSPMPLIYGERLHASVCCTRLSSSCVDCRSSRRSPKVLQSLQGLQSWRLRLKRCWPICTSHALWTLVRRCVFMGTSALPTSWSGTELGFGLYACAAILIWHLLALRLQASVLQSRCGALARSLHLLLSGCLVCCRGLQTRVGALGASAL